MPEPEQSVGGRVCGPSPGSSSPSPGTFPYHRSLVTLARAGVCWVSFFIGDWRARYSMILGASRDEKRKPTTARHNLNHQPPAEQNLRELDGPGAVYQLQNMRLNFKVCWHFKICWTISFHSLATRPRFGPRRSKTLLRAPLREFYYRKLKICKMIQKLYKSLEECVTITGIRSDNA